MMRIPFCPLVLAAAFAISLPSASPPPLPEVPAPASEILLARNFTVESGFPFTWRAERPVVRGGTILVVVADPALIRPRQTAEPVLYAGRQTAWRVSPHNEQGIVVAFVPGPFDPSADAVWFGSPDLPERIDAAAIDREAERAAAAGIRPFGPAAAERAFRTGGDEIALAGRADLLRILHELVLDSIGPGTSEAGSVE